jgi:hypothetical protein
MIHPREELHVHTKAAVHVASGLRNQTHCEFSLKHEDGAAEHRPVLEELEHERRRDLIRGIRDAKIEEWQLGLDGVALNELKFVLVAELVNSLSYLGDHTRVYFHCYSLFASF